MGEEAFIVILDDRALDVAADMVALGGWRSVLQAYRHLSNEGAHGNPAVAEAATLEALRFSRGKVDTRSRKVVVEYVARVMERADQMEG